MSRVGSVTQTYQLFEHFGVKNYLFTLRLELYNETSLGKYD